MFDRFKFKTFSRWSVFWRINVQSYSRIKWFVPAFKLTVQIGSSLRSWNQTVWFKLLAEMPCSVELFGIWFFELILSLPKCLCWRLTIRRWIFLQSSWNENNQFNDLMKNGRLQLPFWAKFDVIWNSFESRFRCYHAIFKRLQFLD